MARLQFLVLAAILASPTAFPAFAAPRQTVCTVTVNSADERESFRRWLPADRFELVELVERGRADWLARACERGVRCDILVVSGHFAGTEFYSSRPDVDETLPVEAIERAQCSASCPSLFGALKEAYLFGCDTLKREPTREHGESSREVMRRLFPGVPLVYGFSSLAPYGRVSGPLLDRYFAAGGAAEVGQGMPSRRLLQLFDGTSLVADRGVLPGDPDAERRAESCLVNDDRVGAAERLAFWHQVLRRPAPALLRDFDRVEREWARLLPEQRGDPAIAAVLASVAGDASAAEGFLAVARAQADATLRLRLVRFAREAAWLDEAGERREQASTMRELLVRGLPGPGEVDLACRANAGHVLEPVLGVLPGVEGPMRVGALAVRACLGEESLRAAVLRGLADPADDQVQAALAYLRHHPVVDAAELREAARRIAVLPTAPMQARALEALARLHPGDREVLESVLGLFATTRSPSVQRAAAEVLLRADRSVLEHEAMVRVLARHRLPGEGAGLVDALLGFSPGRAP